MIRTFAARLSSSLNALLAMSLVVISLSGCTTVSGWLQDISKWWNGTGQYVAAGTVISGCAVAIDAKRVIEGAENTIPGIVPGNILTGADSANKVMFSYCGKNPVPVPFSDAVNSAITSLGQFINELSTIMSAKMSSAAGATPDQIAIMAELQAVQDEYARAGYLRTSVKMPMSASVALAVEGKAASISTTYDVIQALFNSGPLNQAVIDNATAIMHSALTQVEAVWAQIMNPPTPATHHLK